MQVEGRGVIASVHNFLVFLKYTDSYKTSIQQLKVTGLSFSYKF